MQRMAVVVGVLIGSASSVFSQPPDARDILLQARTAAQAVPAVRYEAKGQADGLLAQRVPAMEGTVTLVAVPNATTPKLRLEAQVVPPGRTQPVTLQITCDGTFVTVAEHGQRMFFRRALPIGESLLNNAAALLIREFTAETPYERESQAESLEYRGTEAVGEVECDVVHVVLGHDAGEIRWHFGRTDHLPRRVQRFIRTPHGAASVTTTVSRLEIGPALPVDTFELPRPSGFFGLAMDELLEVGELAPDWTLKTADGTPVTLHGLRGKVVLLDFWASWCGPCLMAMPIVQKLHDKYKDKPVAVYGVNCLERNPKSDPAGFMKGRGFAYPTLVKADRVAQAYQVRGLPTFYLIGPDGRILMAHSGLTPTMEAQVDALIEWTLSRPRPGDEKTSDNRGT